MILLLKGFADIIIADITAGQKTDASQKSGLTHYTRYTVLHCIATYVHRYIENHACVHKWCG